MQAQIVEILEAAAEEISAIPATESDVENLISLVMPMMRGKRLALEDKKQLKALAAKDFTGQELEGAVNTMKLGLAGRIGISQHESLTEALFKDLSFADLFPLVIILGGEEVDIPAEVAEQSPLEKFVAQVYAALPRLAREDNDFPREMFVIYLVAKSKSTSLDALSGEFVKSPQKWRNNFAGFLGQELWDRLKSVNIHKKPFTLGSLSSLKPGFIFRNLMGIPDGVSEGKKSSVLKDFSNKRTANKAVNKAMMSKRVVAEFTAANVMYELTQHLGGVDLSTAHADIRIQKSENGFEFPQVDAAQLARPAERIDPVVVGITPLSIRDVSVMIGIK